MPAFHPTSEAPSIEGGASIAVNLERLGNTFLPSGGRHENFEGRPRRELGLNRLVQQGLIRVVHQSVPLIARNLDCEIIGIESRAGPPSREIPRLAGRQAPARAAL